MTTFSIDTLGCKVNQYESQQIRELLERLGLKQVQTSEKPDLVIINTCCVTHTASAKSRQYIRKAQKLSPDSTIVVCGCLPTVKIGELHNPDENIHFVRHRSDLAATLLRIVIRETIAPNSQIQQRHSDSTIKSENVSKVKCKNELPFSATLKPLSSFKGQTRAFLKVQDGCDGYCTYCIIPQVRPFVRSKSVAAILREAQAFIIDAHKEIVVTGIFLGAYGQNTVRRKNWPNGQNDKLENLLIRLAEIPGLARIRLSSLEPADVTPRLLDVFCQHRNIMPHLHLSLQSGSNAILKRMRRQYTADEFLEKVELIKSRLDRPAISTDIIVGFPGETDADFEQTVKIAKDVGFAKMHVFAFSPRKGTAAAAMQDTLDTKVIKERSKTLRELDAQLQREFRQQFIGETATVLMENDTDQPHGRAERYFVVYLKSPAQPVKRNDLVAVSLIENSKNGVIGEATDSAAVSLSDRKHGRDRELPRADLSLPPALEFRSPGG
jgi:threonylcarbamoyladenosine tRNA methylthiotransferase MtaB